MQFLRHILAIGIVAGFGYLYFQEQQGNEVISLAETPLNSPAGWESFEEAPAFNAAQSAPAQKPPAAEVPQPIPFPTGGKTDLIANLTNWSETIHQDLSSTLKQAQQKLTEAGSGLTDKTPSQASSQASSLWQEPAVEGGTQPLQKTQEQISQQVQDKTRQLTDQLQQKAGEIEQQLQQPVDQAKKAVQNLSGQTSGTGAAAYRQFILGTGEQKTVCIVDASVSQDGLLLSTLFAGLRREWISGLENPQNQSLVMLVADAKTTLESTAVQQELQSRVQELEPVRVVHIVRSNGSRGTLKFNSDDESIAALVSVPGVYKVQADRSANPFAQVASLKDVPAVRMELPQEITTQEQATISLLATALLGNWNERQNLPYTGQVNTVVSKPATDSSGTPETTSSFFKNLYENALGSKKTDTPAEKPEQTLIEQAGTLMTQILGRPETAETEKEDSLLARHESKEPYAPVNTGTNTSTPEHKSPLRPQVELLQPPPVYQSQSSREKTSTGSFDKLPAPPGK